MSIAGDKNPNYRHGLTDGGNYRHPVYTAWQNMKARCLNRNHAKYHRYGGRGITICSEWLSSQEFAKWAFASGWQKGLTLDRRDNDKGYNPGNCQWIILSSNSRKKSTTKITLDQAKSIRKRFLNGEQMKSLAVEHNVSHGTIWFTVNQLTWDETFS